MVAPALSRASSANCSAPEKMKTEDASVSGTPMMARAAAP
jgi:hypothetical protein